MRPREPKPINQVQMYRPQCPRCGGLASLAQIEPSDQLDHDLRTFECAACGHIAVMQVKFK
jgi:hypothetical protein